MHSDFLFVYGTLRRDCVTGAHDRYLAGAQFIAKACVRGWLYRVSYYPALVLDEEADWVQGEIYCLRDAQQLHELDVYEGCTFPSKPEQEYQRQLIDVSITGQSDIRCWIYTYQHPLDNLPVIASGDFLNP
jgi:gamma-glutamylcyclotransferase (GGCT)/AIG2-like uncharacterized protein YtfP